MIFNFTPLSIDLLNKNKLLSPQVLNLFYQVWFVIVHYDWATFKVNVNDTAVNEMR